MAVVPKVLSDWVPQPFVLNNVCYEIAKSSEDNSVVERVLIDEVEYNGHFVTYTENPLPLGQVWQNTILSTIRNSNVGLVSG